MGVSLEYSKVSTAVDHSSNLASFTCSPNSSRCVLTAARPRRPDGRGAGDRPRPAAEVSFVDVRHGERARGVGLRRQTWTDLVGDAFLGGHEPNLWSIYDTWMKKMSGVAFGSNPSNRKPGWRSNKAFAWSQILAPRFHILHPAVKQCTCQVTVCCWFL